MYKHIRSIQYVNPRNIVANYIQEIVYVTYVPKHRKYYNYAFDKIQNLQGFCSKKYRFTAFI